MYILLGGCTCSEKSLCSRSDLFICSRVCTCNMKSHFTRACTCVPVHVRIKCICVWSEFMYTYTHAVYLLFTDTKSPLAK